MENIKPKSGDVYDHKDIAGVAGVEFPSNRYRGLISAWRKRLLRELNIDIEAVIGFGYRVLDDNERVSVGIKDFGLSVRNMGRSAQRIALADVQKLDDTHR